MIDFKYIGDILPTLLKTLPLTLSIFFVSLVLVFVFATLLFVVQLRGNKLLTTIIKLYTSFARSNPGIIHVFLIYYGLPVIFELFGVDINHIDRSVYAVLSLVFYNSSYVIAVLDSSYKSIPQSQFDAAKSIGMTHKQMLKRIILPQILPVALPSLGNCVIDLLQDTSLLFTIGLMDLMGQADTIIANNFGINQLEVYLAIALIYWALTGILSFVVNKIEAKTQKFLA